MNNEPNSSPIIGMSRAEYMKKLNEEYLVNAQQQAAALLAIKKFLAKKRGVKKI